MTLSSDDEGLAAEFALGTLDATERAALAARRQREPELDAAIQGWEARLTPLLEAVGGVAPPADLFAHIETRLSTPPPAIDLTRILSAKLARWRALAGGAGALAAALAATLAFVVVSRPTGPHQFVAVLQKSADDPAFAMTVDLDRLEFSVRPVAAEAPAGKSYELWMIAPNGATPKSLGVIAAGERRLAADKTNVRNATSAVTLEPEGGSPTGLPTSAPVFFGKLVPVGP